MTKRDRVIYLLGLHHAVGEIARIVRLTPEQVCDIIARDAEKTADHLPPAEANRSQILSNAGLDKKTGKIDVNQNANENRTCDSSNQYE